ncbi:MAG: beta-lactamase family protein [Burkholderiales bacterium]|nr:beta-lactamase family protein [Burkholderiales bacterium]
MTIHTFCPHFVTVPGMRRTALPRPTASSEPCRASHRRGAASWLAAFGLGLLLVGCGGSDGGEHVVAAPTHDYGELQREVSRAIESGMQNLQVQGLSIALVDDQSIVWKRGFGMADAEARIPADPDTLYEAGSVSKVFTAAAIMQLTESGRLQLDRPIEEAVPGFRTRARFANAAPITLRNLLTHHSGLPGDLDRDAFAPVPTSLAAQVAWLADEYPAYPPDHIHAYSNVGFTVLGRAVEVASGLEFVAYMEQRVLAPLGMSSSAFHANPRFADRMAKHYGSLLPGDMPPFWLANGVAGGGLRTSVNDLSRFAMAMLNEGKHNGRQLLQPASVREMLRRQNGAVPLDFDFRIGLTWELEQLRGADGRSIQLAYHDGDTVYHHTYLAILPEYGLAVAVMANTESGESLVPRIARETLRRALKAKHGIDLVDPPAPTARPLSDTDPGLLAMAGLYMGDSGVVPIVFSDGSLFFVQDAETLIPLAPHEGGLFKLATDDKERWFSFQQIGGHDLILEHNGYGRYLLGERIRPYTIADNWRQRLGVYVPTDGQSREIVERIELKEFGGFLAIDPRIPMESGLSTTFLVRPESDDLAAIAGLGRHFNEILRFGRDERGEYVIYNGVRLRRAS